MQTNTVETPKPTGLELMREPFLPHQISKLPKPTKAQNEAVKADFKAGIRCTICGGWHHKDVIHLDYVGHAALTDRLLDCDPKWFWEPLAINQDGVPFLDKNGGLWIKLFVCGFSRLGYGHPDGKSGGDAVKEAIGDALRNAAMRFGAALDLWHKGSLHLVETEEADKKADVKPAKPKEIPTPKADIKPDFTQTDYEAVLEKLAKCHDQEGLDAIAGEARAKWGTMSKTYQDLVGKAINSKKIEVAGIIP